MSTNESKRYRDEQGAGVATLWGAGDASIIAGGNGKPRGQVSRELA